MMQAIRPSLTRRQLTGLLIAAQIALGCAPAAAPEPLRSPAEPVSASSPEPPTADDRALVRAVELEADRLQRDFSGAKVRILALDSKTGRTLAAAGPVDDRHPVASTMKAISVASALEAGLAHDATLDCAGPVDVGGVAISDHRPNGSLSVADGLARSSNVCVVAIANTVGWKAMHDVAQRLVPLPQRTASEEAAGIGDLVGHGVKMSTTDLALGYATLANGGVNPRSGERQLREETARQTMNYLRHAVTSPQGTGSQAGAPGMTIGGKTGTDNSDRTRTALFVGAVEHPTGDRVIAVIIEGVSAGAFGGSAAAPAFRRIVEAAVTGSHAEDELTAP